MNAPYSKEWLDNHIACEECDQLIELPDLSPGEQGYCPRCDYELLASPHDGFNRPLAYALAACVLMLVANAYPFLTFKSGGFGNVMTLPQASIALYDNNSPELAFIVFTFIIVIPVVLACLIIFLLLSLKTQRHTTYLVPVARFLFKLKSWNMTEVFLVSVVVSLVKLMHLATILLGTSFYGYIAFAICLTGALGNLDKIAVWKAIGRCSP
jgi:paraquat-inducible protein A